MILDQSNNLFIIIQLFLLTNMKIIFIALLFVLTFTRNYPLFKQCDDRWRNQQLGTSSNTICSAGCLMSSASMALNAIVSNSWNPSTLNTWLKGNSGYVSQDLFVWASINSLGLIFQGKVSNSQIKSNLDAGNVVIMNVHNGGHWVLAYAYSGDSILVNDPGYTTTSYALNEIVDGQNGIYKIGNWFDRFLSNVYYGYILQSSQIRVQDHNDEMLTSQ